MQTNSRSVMENENHARFPFILSSEQPVCHALELTSLTLCVLQCWNQISCSPIFTERRTK